MYQAPATPLSPLPAIPRDPKAIRAAMAMLEILAVWIETDHNDAPAEAREQTRIAANDRADDALNELERAGKGEIAKALYSWHAENV
jgi:hypothetical protein